jgi:uncharacterized protein (PEP-CTERM system associated)
MRFLLPSAVLFVLLVNPVWAAKWNVVPAFSVAENYTDNITLAPEGFEQPDLVTQLIPAIAATAVGDGLRFSVDYAPELTFYARGQQEDQVFHRLNAFGNARLTDKLLHIDAGANVQQYDVSLLGPLTDNNVNVTRNRATVGTFFASPYLLHQFGTSAVVQARFTYSIWNSNDEQSFNNDANTVDLDLSSGPAYRILTGNLNYKRATIDYDTQPDLEAEVVLATARRLVTPTVGLLAQVGDEHYQRVVAGAPTGEEDGGSRWGVGLEWVPSNRMQLTTAAGRRFFGNAYLLDFEYRTRRLTLRAGYSQDVTTTRTEFFSTGANSTADYLDPLSCAKRSDSEACKQEVGATIAARGLPLNTNGPINFFSAEPFLQERFQISAAIQGLRNVLIATVYTDAREALPGFVRTGDFAIDSEVDQTGISLAWNFPLAPRTFFNLYATYDRNKFPNVAREDNVTRFGVGLARQFQPRLFGTLDYRVQQKDSTDSVSSYFENAVSATLRMEF